MEEIGLDPKRFLELVVDAAQEGTVEIDSYPQRNENSVTIHFHLDNLTLKAAIEGAMLAVPDDASGLA